MSTITFVYMRRKYQKIIENSETLLSEMIEELSTTLQISLDNLYCIYLGKSLNNIKKKISDFKSMNLLIFIFNLKNIEVKKDDQLNNLLCPSCENLVSMFINEGGKITLKHCCNKHKLKGLSISSVINLQTSIKGKGSYCSNCNNNLNYYNFYYICSCDNFICPLCMDEHKEKNKDHCQILNNKKYLICEKHNIPFYSFCKQCNRNLCNTCSNDHKGHNKNIITFKEIIQTIKINELKNDIQKFKNIVDKYKKDLSKIREKYAELENNINLEYNNYNMFYNIP